MSTKQQSEFKAGDYIFQSDDYPLRVIADGKGGSILCHGYAGCVTTPEEAFKQKYFPDEVEGLAVAKKLEENNLSGLDEVEWDQDEEDS